MTGTFTDLGIEGPLLALLGDRGIVAPTPVQTEVIPAIGAGRDVIAESPTGTGKTLAYLLPLTQRVEAAVKQPQLLIVAPTHELAMQIFREAEWVFAVQQASVAALIGGVDPKRQLDRLKANPAVIVGTPGRINELASQRKLKLHGIKTVVIDEADRLLDQGFAASVEELLKRTIRDTQRLFFSATLPAEVQQKLHAWVRDACIVMAPPVVAEGRVEHYYLLSEPRKKVDMLRRLIHLLNVPPTMVFVNEIERVDEIVSKLSYHNLACRLLHRDTPKLDRAQTLADFRDGKFPVLISTDLAARGLDIAAVEAVIHFDPATDADTYIHRSGRTGRMDRSGTVISLISSQQRFIIEKFARQTGLVISERIMSYGSLRDPNGPAPLGAPKRRSVEHTDRRGKQVKPASKSKPSRASKPGEASKSGQVKQEKQKHLQGSRKPRKRG